jgi:hypothetical protein
MRRDRFHHGFSEEAWERAKQEALAVLQERAERGDTITYSDLVNQITAVRMEARDVRLAHFLGEISSDEHAARRPLITALVVHKHDLNPGKGFFDLARSLGFEFDEDLAFWSNQIELLQRQWK